MNSHVKIVSEFMSKQCQLLGIPRRKYFLMYGIYIYIDMGCAFCCEAPFYPSQNHIVWIPLVTSWFLHSMKYSCKYRESELEELFAPA